MAKLFYGGFLHPGEIFYLKGSQFLFSMSKSQGEFFEDIIFIHMLINSKVLVDGQPITFV